MAENKVGRPRGFAAISVERRREIARLGGLAVSKENRTFSKNRELAKECGRRGGAAVQAKNRTFSKDRSFAASAGRLGGLKKAGRDA